MFNLELGQFPCKSWIEIYRFIFISPLRQIILKNLDIKSNVFIHLKNKLHILTNCYFCDLTFQSDHTQHEENDVSDSFKDLFRINYDKVQQQIRELLFYYNIFSIDEKTLSYFNNIFWEIDQHLLSNGQNELRPLTIKFLTRICSIYNKSFSFDTIKYLMKNKKLIISTYAFDILF